MTFEALQETVYELIARTPEAYDGGYIILTLPRADLNYLIQDIKDLAEVSLIIIPAFRKSNTTRMIQIPQSPRINIIEGDFISLEYISDTDAE